MNRTGHLRVVDAIEIVDRISSAADSQRSIDFQEADFDAVTAAEVIESSVAALHPDMPFSFSGDKAPALSPSKQQGEWIIAPTLAAADATSADDYSTTMNALSSRTGGGAAGGFVLPPRASLISSGLRPSAGGSSEVYLCGKWRWFVPGSRRTDVVVATVDATNVHCDADAAGLLPPAGGGGDSSSAVSMGFAPSLVRVTLWSVKERPQYEVDVRRPISTLTCARLKKIVHKFSGIPLEDMDLDVPAAGGVTVRDGDAKLFPFAFDPSVVPEVRIRSKNDFVHDGEQSRHMMAVLQHQQYSPVGRMQDQYQQQQQQHFFLTNSDESTRYALAASSAASEVSPGRAALSRVEAEYGIGFANNNSGKQQQQRGGRPTAVVAASPSPIEEKDKLKQVAPEQSRDWAQWLEQRRAARNQHVRGVLVPSSQEQIEVERALQVRSLEDVRRVTKHASADLASAAQMLQQQLEVVREDILRERIGDDAFARTEGARGVLAPGPSKSSVTNDGVNREPLVVNFR